MYFQPCPPAFLVGVPLRGHWRGGLAAEFFLSTPICGLVFMARTCVLFDSLPFGIALYSTLLLMGQTAPGLGEALLWGLAGSLTHFGEARRDSASHLVVFA